MSTAVKKRTSLPGAGKSAQLVRDDTKSKRAGASNRGRPRGARTKFFGFPIVDATEDLVLPLLQQDVEKAIAERTNGVNEPENFLGCVVAQAGTRVCGASRIAILRAHAYVAFPGDKKAKRYAIDKRSRGVLEAWDRGEHIVEGVELRLRAPSKAQTLTALRRASRQYRAKSPGRARKTKRKQRGSDPLHNVVRNGNLVRWG